MTGAMQEEKKRDKECVDWGEAERFSFLSSVIWQGLTDKMPFEQTLEKTRECTMQLSGEVCF